MGPIMVLSTADSVLETYFVDKDDILMSSMRLGCLQQKKSFKRCTWCGGWNILKSMGMLNLGSPWVSNWGQMI